MIPTIVITNGTLSPEEMEHYERYAKDKSGGKRIKKLEIRVDGEYVDLTSHYESTPFERIRRITGYLSQSTRMNEAKKHEVTDRVIHGAKGV